MTWLLLLAVLAAAVVWVASGYARQPDDRRVRAGGEQRVDETPGEHKEAPAREATRKAIAEASSGVRREVSPGPHEHGPGTNPAADLAPEDALGEDRPAARTTAPDGQPTRP